MEEEEKEYSVVTDVQTVTSKNANSMTCIIKLRQCSGVSLCPHYGLFYCIRRVTGTAEKTQLQEYLSAMLECNFKNILLETLTQDYFLQQSSGFDDYFSCYRSQNISLQAKACFNEVSICGTTAEQSMKHGCPVLSRLMKTRIRNGHDLASANQRIEAALMQEGVTITTKVKKLIELFGKRQACLSKVRNAIQQCLELAVKRCSSSSLRVLEINRMKMEDMDFIIQAFPHVHYFYYTRDPRGISLSRSRTRKLKVIEKDTRAITEARYLCPRMQRDVVEFRQLERKYPGLIHHVRYEDFVTNPIAKSVEVYGRFGDTPPPQWASFTEENMHAKRKTKNYYQVKNATETATSWMRDIPAADLREMDDLCGEVLDTLGYPRYRSIS